MTSIAYFPVISDEKSLIDVLSRAAWFLSFAAVDRIHVPIASSELGSVPKRVAPGMDPGIADRFGALEKKLEFVVATKESDLEACMSSANIILRWGKDAKPTFVSNATLARWLKGKKVWDVDPVAVRMEGSFYIEVGLHLTADKPALIHESQSKFAALVQKLGRFNRAYLLATGPSVVHYRKHDFRDAMSIVCNSVILDESLMNEVEPQILVFADPIFHFGPSQYAAAFRRALLESARKHDFVICTPFKYYPLFLNAVPELADRTMGIPFTKNREFNFALDEDFNLKTTANILTFLMVPLAATFSDKVGILGCDGRPLSEDKYFWGHNPKTQINDKMANIREVHPAFFAINYNDYYLEHCGVLEEQLRAGESAGKRFHSLAFSHIPALASRTKRTWRKFSTSTDRAPTRVVMLDPDGINSSGHYLAYNSHLGEALAKRGCDPIVLCSTEIDRGVLAQHPNFRPRLSVKSWTFGAAEDSPSHRMARDEILTAVDEVMTDGPALLYMYAGSLNHAEVLAEATRRHANLYVNINLFWLSFKDFLSKAAYVERWRAFFHWLDCSGPRFVATVPTIELQNEIACAFGVVLDVAPHPSTAFADDQLMKKAAGVPSPRKTVNVLFPGSMRSEKGYEVGVECAKFLGDNDAIQTTIRYVITPSTPGNLQQQPRDLPANAHLVMGKLDNDEFMRIFIENDIVVLPYSPEAFSKRTSGLLIDSLACGLPAVVVEGTWLAGHVRRQGCGVVVPDASVDSLCAGICKLAAELDAFRETTARAAERYFRDNSWACLAAFLMSPFGAGDAYPRLLVIDLTAIGGFSATARVKEAFFRGWPQRSLGVISVDPAKKCLRSDGLGQDGPATEAHLLDAARAFAPDVVYYRAVEHELVHGFANKAIKVLERPYVIHLMDDWPTRLQASDPAAFARIDASLRQLLVGASAALSIGDAMSMEFGRRYGVEFTPFANAIDPAAFPPRKTRQVGAEFVVSYAGALAEDMVLDSVANTAFAIDSLPRELNVRLNIHTRTPWHGRALKTFEAVHSVSVLEPVPATNYYAVLQDSDAMLIAYNFDRRSRDYIGYSIANKMPECLASGTPILAVGPRDVATIDYLEEAGAAMVVNCPDQLAITKALRQLVASRETETPMQQMAREIAFTRHNVWDVATRFRTLLSDVASRRRDMAAAKRKDMAVGERKNMIEQPAILGPYGRGQHAHWDETQAVAQLYGSRLHGSTMIDVGAHHGSALMPFLNVGWRIFAFEPDEKNRAKLLERLAKHKHKDKVRLDIRAVSDHAEKNLSFYRSEVSTGISGLSAFHESHHEAQRVDTVSLSEALAGSQLASVDFLKIDTEGHDLFVLKGFPWDRLKPAVVECEFEDSKTVPLGYDFHQLGDYLVQKGYTVYVSEWHPVIRYGVRHDWHRLMSYPCELSDEKAWGNLLAFRDAVEAKAVVDAARKVMRFGSQPPMAAQPPLLPIPLSPTGADGMPYRVVADHCFTKGSRSVWNYAPGDERYRTWAAEFDLGGLAPNSVVLAGIRIRSDRTMDVTVSLTGRGDDEYERARSRVRLSPDVPQHVQLKKSFARQYPKVKIQVEVNEVQGGDSAKLAMDSIYLLEAPSALRQRIPESQVTLKTANKIFRQGDHATALGLYLLLHRKHPLRIYGDNALMSARRLGMPACSLPELMELDE